MKLFSVCCALIALFPAVSAELQQFELTMGFSAGKAFYGLCQRETRVDLVADHNATLSGEGDQLSVWVTVRDPSGGDTDYQFTREGLFQTVAQSRDGLYRIDQIEGQTTTTDFQAKANPNGPFGGAQRNLSFPKLTVKSKLVTKSDFGTLGRALAERIEKKKEYNAAFKSVLFAVEFVLLAVQDEQFYSLYSLENQRNWPMALLQLSSCMWRLNQRESNSQLLTHAFREVAIRQSLLGFCTRFAIKSAGCETSYGRLAQFYSRSTENCSSASTVPPSTESQFTSASVFRTWRPCLCRNSQWAQLVLVAVVDQLDKFGGLMLPGKAAQPMRYLYFLR